MAVELLNEMEQRVWELATDKSLQEVAVALSQLLPCVPPTPEVRLQAAIFGRRLTDYRATLAEIFLRLHHPHGEWEDYLGWCRVWVTGMLDDAVRYETDLLKEPLQQQMATLPQRLKVILSVRFGFDDQGAKTLERTGKEFNLSKERIRQLEAKALHMLRHPSRSQHLRHVMPGERLRTRLFSEINRSSATPPIFLMWEEDYEVLLSLRKSIERAAKSKEKQSEVPVQQNSQENDVHEEKRGHTESLECNSPKDRETLHNVQQQFSFQDL